MTHSHQNLLGGPDPVLLPRNPEAEAEFTAGAAAAEVAAHHPTASLAWAALAEEALHRSERALRDTIEAYAYARTGYHRGLDQLRRAGWKGHGPVPWEHEPNRGFLRCLHALARAAAAIGEEDEATRCTLFLRDSSSAAEGALTLGPNWRSGSITAPAFRGLAVGPMAASPPSPDPRC